MDSSFYGERPTTDTSTSRYNTTTASTARAQSFRRSVAAASASPHKSGTISEPSPYKGGSSHLGLCGGSGGGANNSLEVDTKRKMMEVSIDKHNQYRTRVDSASTNCSGVSAAINGKETAVVSSAAAATSSDLKNCLKNSSCETFL